MNLRKIKTDYMILVFLFLFVLGVRLYFTFQHDNFNTDNAYFHLRQIEYFSDNFKLLNYDDLSYGGRQIFYPPFFHVFMALISFGSIFMLKLVPELLLASTVFIVYRIAKEISGNSYSAILSAASASFIPILFTETLNNLSVYSIVIPLLLFMLYSLLRLDEKIYFWGFVAASFLLPLTHPSAFIYVITISFYFFLIAGGALLPSKIKKEAVIFSILLIFLFQFIIYKEAFLTYGANILKQNIPSTILADSFRQLGLVDVLFGIGIIPLVLGSFGIYFALIRERRKVAYLFGAFAVSILLLLVLRLITISVGLMFLGIALSIFTASGVSFIHNYLNKLKFIYLKHFFVILLLGLFVVLSVLPSFVAARNSAEIDSVKIGEIKWLILNTDKNDVVLANVDDGNLIAAVAKRKTVADTNFLFAPNPSARVDDIKTMYTTVSEAIALNLIHKYNVTVIYLSDESRREYNLVDLAYAEKFFGSDDKQLTKASKCFDLAGGEENYYVVEC